MSYIYFIALRNLRNHYSNKSIFIIDVLAKKEAENSNSGMAG